MTIDQHTTTVMKGATAAQYVGGGGAVVFGLTPSEWSVIGVIGGLLIALAGFIVNWHYKHQHYKLTVQRQAGPDK